METGDGRVDLNVFGNPKNDYIEEHYEEDNSEDMNFKVPKVNLLYPDDYMKVKNLPSHKMKRSSRKRVRGWARRTLSGLLSNRLGEHSNGHEACLRFGQWTSSRWTSTR